MPSKTALVDPRNLDLVKIRQCKECCILHYVVCGLPWLKSKYEILGSFEDAWFGGRLPIAPSFHLDARDALKNGTVEDMWNSQVVFSDQKILAQHVEAGVLLRIDKPCIALGGKVLTYSKVSTEDCKKESVTTSIEEFTSKTKENSPGEEKTEKKKSEDTFTYSKAWMMSQAVQNFL